MFSLVDFQLTIAELLVLVMKTFGLAMLQIQLKVVFLLRSIAKYLDRNDYSKLDEEVPMEIDHP